jgi:hypothetical protein
MSAQRPTSLATITDAIDKVRNHVQIARIDQRRKEATVRFLDAMTESLKAFCLRQSDSECAFDPCPPSSPPPDMPVKKSKKR